jgi:HUS1 checkpoint protein
VWAEVQQSHFFTEYSMDGVTKDNPEIYLELEPDRLAKTLNALKSSNAARSLKIKLTRKHDLPCLTFEIELASSAALLGATNANPNYGAAGNRVCTHDIPVSIIPRKLWRDFREPELPAFDVSVYLPPDLKQLKHLLERYKSLGSQFVVHANRNGHFKMALETDECNVVTHFKKLEIPRLDETNSRFMQQSFTTADDDDGDDDSDDFYSVRVELKRFSLFLASAADQISPRKVIVNLVSGKMIHIFLVHDDVNVQYFIPALHN